MRVLLLLQTVPKANTYAENLLQSVLRYYRQCSFQIIEATNLQSSINIPPIEQDVVLVSTAPNGFSKLFWGVRVKSYIKKNNIRYFIQLVQNNWLQTSVPGLIIPIDSTQLKQAHKVPSGVFIALPSEAQKTLLRNEKESLQEQLCVLPAVAQEIFQPISWSDKQSLKIDYTEGRDYFLLLATGKSKDQFLTLLKAFSAFKKWQRSSMKLVVCGLLPFTRDDDWQEKLSSFKYRDDVVFLPEISTEKTARMLAGAYVFVHTPTSETDVVFLLNAMKCGTPCIAYHTDTVAEYAGDTAVLLTPDNMNGLSEKMILLYKDETMRNRLAEAAATREQKYSFEQLSPNLQRVLFSTPEV